jgi:fatty-acyl-CoA synthase
VPPFLAHRFSAALIRVNVDSGEPVRNADGFCIRCAANEAGEALGRIAADRTNVGGRFDGYTSRDASEKKVLRDVFEPGDAWFRTGDLMRRDEQGYYYFVDRLGDTFRWKGENVATSEVAEAICSYPGVTEANVYGVSIPGSDGRAGMAAIVAADGLDLGGLRAHLAAALPEYARPLFLRIRDAMDVTTTFKYTKGEFVRDGYSPAATADPIYFNAREQGAFVRVDDALFARINAGDVRL